MDRVYQGLSLPSAQDPGGSEMFALVNSKQMIQNLNSRGIKIYIYIYLYARLFKFCIIDLICIMKYISPFTFFIVCYRQFCVHIG